MTADIQVENSDSDVMLGVIKAACDLFADSIEAVADLIVPLVEWAGKTIMAFSNACYAHYDAAGSPYGPSSDGMFRWLDEQLHVVMLD